ncbi:hypothetical protein N026_19805 [Pseudomonas syringae UB303]|uniref:Transposase IS66 C-terminal domain-containing protein n=1 Tax=Pseudomonas syringae UB303 TaxID=1357287 RepID=A0AAJ4E5G9_PSESX|nr:hypothetical protein N026_19805 [Pseudomonas syringae UB303]
MASFLLDNLCLYVSATRYAYLKDVLTRLPTQRASDATDLLPHRWAPV